MNVTKKAAGLLTVAVLAIGGLLATAPAHAASAGPAATAAQAQPATAVVPPNRTAPAPVKGLRPLSRAEVERLFAAGTTDLTPNLGGVGFSHYQNDHSGQCLAVPGGSTVNGTGLIQWPCANFLDHFWEAQYAFTQGGLTWYHMVNLNSRQCLAVPGGSKAANVQVIQWPCGNYADHYWTYYDDQIGTVIQNYNSGQDLSVRGASLSAGAVVIQYPWGPYVDQHWS